MLLIEVLSSSLLATCSRRAWCYMIVHEKRLHVFKFYSFYRPGASTHITGSSGKQQCVCVCVCVIVSVYAT